MKRAVALRSTLSPSRVDLEQGRAEQEGPIYRRNVRIMVISQELSGKGLSANLPKGYVMPGSRGRSWLEWVGNVNVREGGSSTWTCRDASEKGKRTTPKNTLIFYLCFAAWLQNLLEETCCIGQICLKILFRVWVWKNCQKISSYCLFVHPISWGPQYKFYSSIYQIETPIKRQADW